MSIRQSVFETNSSSAHTVVIGSGTDFNPVEISGGKVVIEPGEFGWGPDKLTSWRDKASYAYTHAVNYGTPAQMAMLRKVLEDYTKLPVHFLSLGEDAFYDTGYIDHQSIGEATQMFEDEATLRAALFGKGGFIIIDNDNH